MSKNLHCPKCKSTDLQCMVSNQTTVSSTGGGYGVGKGCLGYLLLGPLGLLCGACGSKQKITSENHQSTFWACKSCGEKFRDVDEIKAESSAIVQANEPKKILITGLVMTICFVLLAFIILDSKLLGIMLGIGCTVAFAVAYSNAKKVEDEKLSALYRERKYIEDNAYGEK